MKLKIFSLIISFLFIIDFGLPATLVQAQTISLDLYPPLLEVTLKPGKSITQVYKITNNSEQDFIMKSQIVPFEPADELGNIQLNSNNQSPAREWFSFQNADLQLGQSFLLKSGQPQQVVLAVKTPTNAKEDDYYLTLLFETQPSGLNEGLSEARAQAKIGANILLTVSETGEPPRRAEIAEFKIQKTKFKIIDSFAQPQFVLKIKNIGRSLFKPMGTITTTGWLGQKYFLNLLPENILVKSTRQMACESNSEGKTCLLPSKFLFGPYETKVEFGLDKVSADYSTKITFIALPLKLIFVVLLLIILIMIIKLVQNRFKLSLDK
jgi:hypothetical protein